MNARRLIVYLVLNAVVSATATLAVLWWWDRTHPPPAVPVASLVDPRVTPWPTGTPAPTPPPTPSPTPLIHTVQSGDTLGGLAERYDVSVEDLMAANNLLNPDVLSPGQVLIIPAPGYAATQSAPPPTAVPQTIAPLATATRDPNQPLPQLAIREVTSPGDLPRETVVIVNNGGPVDLTGWTLRSETGQLYTFPALTLFQGGAVNVHTAAGQDTVIDLYWGRTQAAWASGRLVLLSDPAGTLQARFEVP